jgi:hypothetical protein
MNKIIKKGNYTMVSIGTGTYTIKTIVAEVKSLQEEIKDYEKTFSEIRGKDWKNGIEKDERPSVKSLRSSYIELLERYETLLVTKVTI